MQQLKGFQGPGTAQGLNHIQHLAGGQAEFRLLTAGVLPVAFADGGQPCAHTNQRSHSQTARFLEDERQLGLFFHHNEHPVPQFLPDQRQPDIFAVLVAIADNHRLLLARQCQNRH